MSTLYRYLSAKYAQYTLSINFGGDNGYVTSQFCIRADGTYGSNTSGDSANDSLGLYHQFIFGPNISNKCAIRITDTGESMMLATNYTAYSDYRLKNHIRTLDNTHTVDDIRVVSYDLASSPPVDGKPNHNRKFGVIAHELAEIYPELVNGEKDGLTMQSVDYIGLIPILINEIQTMKQEIRYLRAKIDASDCK